MSPVVQQLFTLAGVVLGAGATFTVTTSIERTKWRRSLDTRWDDKRLAAYSEYANALKKFVDVLLRIAAAKGYPAGMQPVDRGGGLEALADADADRTVKWEAVLLLGSPEAIEAARRWHKAAWHFSLGVLGEGVDHQEYLRLFEAMGHRRNEFYDCARADLGVTSGPVPAAVGAWLPPKYRASNPGPANQIYGEHNFDMAEGSGARDSTPRTSPPASA
ncbi:hypothetical protein [Nocardia transvalensis]|uniref:hypothetical protein n=1 Tax=Nocardia transvalensis TaxID=37333 RepID=UPI0018943EEE|nr:hypothetical protein [Nocardia transvalensis]MBF6331718.1 hypothetical protein [Nocardia transvalensis]